MKTAINEILEHCKKLISEGHQIDTQGLVHWIEDTLLEMEKQQIIDAYRDGRSDQQSSEYERFHHRHANGYYNETFKSE